MESALRNSTCMEAGLGREEKVNCRAVATETLTSPMEVLKLDVPDCPN